MSNQPDTRLSQIANLTAGAAAAPSIKPSQQTQTGGTQTQESQTAAPEPVTTITKKMDLNGDGVVSNDELKITTAGGQTQMSQLGSFLSGNNNSNFSQSSGEQAGTPEASVLPADTQRLQNIMMLMGPETGIDLYKHENTQRATEAAMLKARADANEARIKQLKFDWETSPAYVQRQGQIEYAKKMGDKQAELWLREDTIKGASSVPNKYPELQGYGKTLGDVMRAFGTTDLSSIVNNINSARARIDAAKITASGTKEAAGISGASVERAALVGLLTNADSELRRLEKVEVPLDPKDPQYANQRTAFLTKAKVAGSSDDVKRKEDLQQQVIVYRSRLAQLGDVGGTTAPAPAKASAKTTVVKEGVTKEATTIEGVKVPANYSWRIIVKDGKQILQQKPIQ